MIFNVESKPIQFNLHRSLQCAAENPVRLRQPLELTKRRLAPLHNRARRKNFPQRLDDHFLALVHSERRNLHDQNIVVFVNNQSAQESLSALTTRKDDASGICLRRNASAARMRSMKNSRLISTRSGASTRTWILDFEL